MRLKTAAAAAFILFCAPVQAQTAEAVNASLDSVFGEHERFEAAFAGLKEAVAAGDAEAVAALAAYPLVVAVGERREVESADEFVALYETFMTDEIVAAVAGQGYETLFASDQGIMFGNGQVWMTGVCFDDACTDWDVRIVTIQSTAQ